MFWHLRGHWSEGRRWAEASLRLTSAGASGPRALALCTAGLLAWAQDDRVAEGEDRRASERAGSGSGPDPTIGIASELLDAAVTAAGAAVDPLTIADTAGIRGLVGLSAGEPGVERYLERSAACYRQAGSEGGVAVSMLRLGLAALTRGDLDQAAALIDDAVARYRALGSVWGTATAMCNRADVHRAEGEWEQAAVGYADGFRRYLTISAGWYSAGAAAGLATALTGLERHSAAAAMYGAAEAALERLRMPMHPLDLPPFETGRAATRRALGDRYARLAAAGRSWSDAELLAAVDAVVAPE
jgi:hypothetical protein